MTPGTFGPYVLAALPYAGAEALAIAGWCALPFAVLAVIILAVRHRRRLRALMDDGDGQGGVPPIARRLAEADAQTQAVSMRDLTAMERIVPACPEFCADLRRVGDPGDCKCQKPCGRDWCTRKRELERNPVPVTWGERERGIG